MSTLKAVISRYRMFPIDRILIPLDIKYRGLRLAAAIARYVPIRLGYSFSALFGNALFLSSAKHRNIVGKNVAQITGAETGKSGQRRIVRNVFINVAKNYFDLTKLPELSPEDIGENVSIEGWDYLAKAIAARKGVIIASAHLGNFEFMARFLVLRGVNMGIFVEPYGSTPFLRCVAKLRQRNGAKILPISASALKESLQILRDGGTICLACDRDIQGNGLKVRFFGEETSLPLGAINLALRTGAEIIPLFSVRLPNNRFVLYIDPPLKLVDTGNRNHSMRINLEKLAAVMENYIRQYPEQLSTLQPIWVDRD